MSLSNNFVVQFEGCPIQIDKEIIEFMCDEAQLPNINTATGQQTGLYTGLGQIDYPHTRVYTELQLGFMLDANLSALKFFNQWHDYIFSEEITPASKLTLDENRVTKLRFRNDYACTIKIRKTEVGPESTTQRNPVTYVLEKAYPFAIDAVPLQFGTAQITKVTVQFKYQRHYTQAFDVTKVKGDVSKMNNISPAGKTIPGPKTPPPSPVEPVVWNPEVVPGSTTPATISEEPIKWSPSVVLSGKPPSVPVLGDIIPPLPL